MIPKLLSSLTIMTLLFNVIHAQEPVQVKEAGALKMQGAYNLTRQLVNAGNGDSSTNIQQLKIYTDKYLMYAHKTADNKAQFGVGTYRIENGKVYEDMFYNNDGPQKASYELAVNKSADGYTQVINFPADNQGNTFILTEQYNKTGTHMTTPLDGAWKEVKVVMTSPDGKTTIDDNPVQYKMYQDGNYMWAHNLKDAASGKMVPDFGYGTFTMDGLTKATETPVSGTSANVPMDQKFMLNLKFTGKDRYEQSITFPDGTKMVETYERMK